ncbi:tryptophan transporter [Salimicrobium halophilum]|uniref:Tryptophan transporter TrpP n=1 Tax=Salimicrobium halophilum TaxID=86666 RepID=A0A1G8TRF9_9BACI|nr:tryptophan transporter [Salimicrobium halophilum]SDJ43290.1 Tryptophan transporter TrpP [Salimicrobium halophilum]
MNTRVLVLLSLFVGIGAVLHAVMPPIFFGMRPDMLLAMMFLGILMFPKLSYVLVLSVATGFVSALTTTVPGGQIANLIEKPITGIIVFGAVLAMQKVTQERVKAAVITAAGTIISGSIFLSLVLFVIGLMEAGFIAMFLTVVLPTALLNTVLMMVLQPVAEKILRRSPSKALRAS